VLLKTVGKNSLMLGMFAVVTAGLLAFTYVNTKDRIAEQERRAAEAALLDILPRSTHDNNMLEDTWQIPDADLAELGLHDPSKIYLAKRGTRVVAAIIPAIAADGYGGDIKLIAGVSADGSIAGVRVISHKETPGLGDRIDLRKSNWILSFDGKSLRSPPLDKWKVKKDGGAFDQLTGATITPRAVVRQVRDILVFAQKHHSDIFSAGTP